jgi:histidinol-phosphatase
VPSDLDLALRLADLADSITERHFRDEALAVELKPDATPVTVADREVEEKIRAELGRQRPGDAVLGEELGSTSGRRRWIVDPIDGTKNFIRGIPVWATLIALEVEGELELGVVSAPALGRRWWAARDGGAFANGEPIAVSSVGSIENALVLYTSTPSLDRAGYGERFQALARRCWAARGFGDFWAHVLVAEGAAEIAVEAELALWDIAAPAVIVREAGGRMTKISADDSANVLYVSTNGLLEEEALACLTA